MKPEERSLEEELASLVPREISPELHTRLAEQLAEPLPPRSRWPRRAAILVAGLAAGVAAFWLMRDEPQVSFPQKYPPRVPAVVVAPVEQPRPFPTVWDYNQALARSPQELDALLDSQPVHFAPSLSETPSAPVSPWLLVAKQGDH